MRFVVCIDDRESDGELTRGAVYPAVATYGRFICITAGPRMGWYASRFKPAPRIDSLLAICNSTRAGAPAHQGA